MRQHVKHTAKKVHHHINRHAIFWVAFLFASMIIALQLLYPLDRAMPFAKFGSQSVGYKSYDDIAVQANNYFINSRANIHVDEKRNIGFKLGEAGASPDIDATAISLIDYPIWQRMIPLSILFKTPSVQNIVVKFDEQKLTEFSNASAVALTMPAKDAGLEIKDGKLVATDDVVGTVVEASDISSSLLEQKFGLVYTTIDIDHKEISAKKPKSYFEAVKSRAETLIALPIIINVDNQQIIPTEADKASWLKIGEDENHKAILGVNSDGLLAYLRSVQTKFTTPAGQTQVTRVDGHEIERIEGEAGQTIDIDTLQSRLSEIITTLENQPLTASYVPVAPTVIINKKYSSTQAGLQAYINDQSEIRNVRISVQQIGGNGWVAGARDTESTVSASTYKLFVALMLFNKMDKGEITWDTPILDTNTKGCFERMIVASTNACAEEWINQFGRNNINNFIYSKGFSSGTSFTNPIANHTTTADLSRYFKGLHEGWLMSDWSRQYLLDALSRHHYTKGIPGGSAGSVHNKVGFLWDYSNDSAIVYHPKGTYAIAIMTKGLSFYAIADITREIEAIMYP